MTVFPDHVSNQIHGKDISKLTNSKIAIFSLVYVPLHVPEVVNIIQEKVYVFKKLHTALLGKPVRTGDTCHQQ